MHSLFAYQVLVSFSSPITLTLFWLFSFIGGLSYIIELLDKVLLVEFSKGSPNIIKKCINLQKEA